MEEKFNKGAPMKSQSMISDSSYQKPSRLRFEMKDKHLSLKDVSIEWNDLGKKLSSLTGVEDCELALRIIDRASSCLPGSEETQKNTILHSMNEQRPADLHEARLCAQSVVLYEQGMAYLKRAEGALDDDVFDKQGWNQIFMKHAIKLLDLHSRTIEALNRYRQRGEQRIIVQHLNVDNGSQAIVNNGNMMVDRGGVNKKSEEPHE